MCDVTWIDTNTVPIFIAKLYIWNSKNLEKYDKYLEYDVKLLPAKLKSIAWMVGRWRSEFGGKAFFPTIPKFTYGEQVDITIADNSQDTHTPLLNYT